jgi:glutaredoxin/glutathione-dependent peroxiredoxin
MLSRSFLKSRLTLAAQRRLFSTIKVGDSVPSAKVSVVSFDAEKGFASEIVDTQEYFKNKKIVLVGYPGAFTPTCMATHIPQYIENATQITADGTEILAMSVNDPFVVSAFAEKLGGKHLINYIADGNGDFTKALGLDFDLSAVQLGPIRTKRMSMVIDNGKVSHFNNEDGPALTEVSACSTVLKQKAL